LHKRKNWLHVGKEGLQLGRDAGRLRSIAISVRYVGQTKNVRNILFRNGVFSSLVVVIPALMPVVLLKELQLDGSSLGLVFASMGVGSVFGAIFVIPWLRSRFAIEHLMLIAQITLAGVYVLMAMVHHCLYCLIPMALAGASWTLAASELWVIAQRAIPNSARGRISALIMVLSQGAMTLSAIAWGMTAQLMGLKERGQPFRKELPDTIKSRFDSFWSASQNLADLSVRQIVVRK